MTSFEFERSNRQIQLLVPDWPTPERVKSVISTRNGGYSLSPYDGANLGDHVGDDLEAVLANREQLKRQTQVEHWQWLKQVHGTHVVSADRASSCSVLEADASMTSVSNVACAILTADCLPVLVCDREATQVAAAHAGWRGLVSGVIANTVETFVVPRERLMVYLGPAIGPRHFEVGQDVVEACERVFAKRLQLDWERVKESCFVPNEKRSGFFLADLYQLARIELQQLGITAIYGGNYCTYAADQQFFSYRRNTVTGRMVSAIWLHP